MIKNRLVLIDSFALIYRAFYGIPPSLTHDGHPINAAYGFTSALLASIKELQPEYLVAAFDLPKKTLRHEHYAEYKATRKPMPDDLVPQIQYCKKVLETMNIPIVSAEGYEGEDVIATIVHKVESQKSIKSDGIESIIVTGDMDTLQLIDDTTKVYSMARGAKQAELIGANWVKERYGLEPSQFVDFKALKGDASDNIPGVPGIGEKGAASLIQNYGSLENLYRVILSDSEESRLKTGSFADKSAQDDIKKTSKELKISEKVLRLLLENKETAFLSQKLSKIDCEAPIEFNLPDSRVHDYDLKKVVKLFNELGFKSLIPRLPIADKIDNRLSLF